MATDGLDRLLFIEIKILKLCVDLVPEIVSSFSVLERGTHHLKLEWQPPTEINGVLEHFRITYRGSFYFICIVLQCKVGNDRVNIFYRVANPSIWMYYLPDPSTNHN